LDNREAGHVSRALDQFFAKSVISHGLVIGGRRLKGRESEVARKGRSFEGAGAITLRPADDGTFVQAARKKLTYTSLRRGTWAELLGAGTRKKFIPPSRKGQLVGKGGLHCGRARKGEIVRGPSGYAGRGRSGQCKRVIQIE